MKKLLAATVAMGALCAHALAQSPSPAVLPGGLSGTNIIHDSTSPFNGLSLTAITSQLQTQITANTATASGAIPSSKINAASGVAGLDASRNVTAPIGSPSINVSVSPSILTCPVANAPGCTNGTPTVGTSTLSSVYTHATTTQTLQQEYLVSHNLFVTTGYNTSTGTAGQKVVEYLGLDQKGSSAGSAWNFNTDIIRDVGTPAGSTTIGYELDFSNWAADSNSSSGGFSVGEWIAGQSSFASTAGLYIATQANSGSSYQWHDGVLFSGDQTDEDNDILTYTKATYALHIEGSHSGAAIYDNSTEATGLEINGNHSNQDIVMVDSAPIGIQGWGSYSTAFLDTTHATTSMFAQLAAGQKLCFNGTSSCATYSSSENEMQISPTSGISLGITTSGQLNINGTSGYVNIGSDTMGVGAVIHAVTSGVNNVRLDAASTGFGPLIAAQGSDTNVSLNLQGKGTGIIQVLSMLSATQGLQVNGLIQETLTTPASSSATCTAGQFTDDSDFHYVCVSTNVWKRVALSTF